MDQSTHAETNALKNPEKLQRILRLARDAGIEEMSYLDILAIVGRRPQIAPIDLIQEMTQNGQRSQAAVSRACQKMSKRFAGKPGLDLLIIEFDEDDRRRRMLSLTPRGQKLHSRLMEVFDA